LDVLRKVEVRTTVTKEVSWMVSDKAEEEVSSLVPRSAVDAKFVPEMIAKSVAKAMVAE